MTVKVMSRADLESSIDDARSALNRAESALDEAERQLDALDLETPDVEHVTTAARRLWIDFDTRHTNRFKPEDALIEAIRELERNA